MIFNLLPLAPSEYDPKEKLGWLCPYYTRRDIHSGILSGDYWRYNTYSPAILDYKAGLDDKLDFFVTSFIQLVDEIVKIEGLKRLALVPLPTSKPKSSPNYKTTPNLTNNPNENRDNRNLIFCQKVSQVRPAWNTIELIQRITPKSPKSRMPAEEQIKTLQIDKTLLATLPKDIGMVLMDDVHTLGDTMSAAKTLISRSIQGTVVIGVVLGKTTH